MLHYWYVESFASDCERHQIGHGVVTRHKRLTDGTWIHTSAVKDIHVDTEAEELAVTTMNSVYQCPIAYCDWEHQDFCEYYFHSLYYVPEDSEDNTPCEYSAYPHEGQFISYTLLSLSLSTLPLITFTVFESAFRSK